MTLNDSTSRKPVPKPRKNSPPGVLVRVRKEPTIPAADPAINKTEFFRFIEQVNNIQCETNLFLASIFWVNLALYLSKINSNRR